MENRLRLTEGQAKLLNNLNAELRAGKKVIYRPVETCRALERLTGKTEAELKVWDMMRPEFKTAYPLEAGPLCLALNKIRQRLKRRD